MLISIYEPILYARLDPTSSTSKDYTKNALKTPN